MVVCGSVGMEILLKCLGLWCVNDVVVVAVDLWVVVGWWCCGVVIFFIILIDYCKIMIILIGPSVTLDFPLIW